MNNHFQQFRLQYLQLTKEILADRTRQLMKAADPSSKIANLSVEKSRLLDRLFSREDGSYLARAGMSGQALESVFKSPEIVSDLKVYFDSKSSTTRQDNPLKTDQVGQDQLFFLEHLRSSLSILTKNFQPEFINTLLPSVQFNEGQGEIVEFGQKESRLSLGIVETYFAAKEQLLIKKAEKNSRSEELSAADLKISNPYRGLGDQVLVETKFGQEDSGSAPAGSILFQGRYYFPITRDQLTRLTNLPAGADWRIALGDSIDFLRLENGHFFPLRKADIVQFEDTEDSQLAATPKELINSLQKQKGREQIYALVEASKGQILPLPSQSTALNAGNQRVVTFLDSYMDAKGNFVFPVYDTRDQSVHLVQLNVKDAAVNQQYPLRFYISAEQDNLDRASQQMVELKLDDQQLPLTRGELTLLAQFSVQGLLKERQKNQQYRVVTAQAFIPKNEPSRASTSPYSMGVHPAALPANSTGSSPRSGSPSRVVNAHSPLPLTHGQLNTGSQQRVAKDALAKAASAAAKASKKTNGQNLEDQEVELPTLSNGRAQQSIAATTPRRPYVEDLASESGSRSKNPSPYAKALATAIAGLLFGTGATAGGIVFFHTNLLDNPPPTTSVQTTYHQTYDHLFFS